jgi:hypothetical protein
MLDATVTTLVALELLGLIALWVVVRRAAARRAAGAPRAPRALRITGAVLGAVVLLGFPIVMAATIHRRTTQHERTRERLTRTGVHATAVITHVEETGTVINRRPEVRVRLSVRPADGSAFPSTWTSVFSVADVQTYRVGTTVDVRFDTEDPGTSVVVGVPSAK